MGNKKMRDAAEVLAGWLLSESEDALWTMLGILATLPGADRLREVVEAMGPRVPSQLAWAEWSVIRDFVEAAEYASDVEGGINILFRELGWEEEEGEYDE